MERPAGSQIPQAPESYAGKLIVLVNKGVASSGETFTQLAGQIEGAVVVGENTSGCTDYGNVQEREPLPHSHFRMAFGRTKFIVDWVRSNREGFGFFPDYWLDAEDPLPAIGAWTGGSRPPDSVE